MQYAAFVGLRASKWISSKLGLGGKSRSKIQNQDSYTENFSLYAFIMSIMPFKLAVNCISEGYSQEMWRIAIPI